MGMDISKYIPKEYFMLFPLITTISGASISKISAIKDSENSFDHSNKNLIIWVKLQPLFFVGR
jgi:hypothetical protein